MYIHTRSFLRDSHLGLVLIPAEMYSVNIRFFIKIRSLL
jgi:hypothetical protein